MGAFMSIVGFPGKSACALLLVHRLRVNESHPVLKPVACSLGEQVSKFALGVAPLLSNKLRHFLKVTMCSTWGQLSKFGAGDRWPVRIHTSDRAIGRVLVLPAKLARRIFSMESVAPFKSMRKAQNFNLMMCCPGQHPTIRVNPAHVSSPATCTGCRTVY
jgi:hypothetical protein